MKFPTLAEVLDKHRQGIVHDGWWECYDCGKPHNAEHQAAAWRDACTITTVEQLDTLPEASVIHVPHKRTASSIEKRHGLWWPSRSTGPFPNLTRDNLLPALLIWYPEWSKR
ncbi:hypothetical protein [Mycolicibacterium peregrinum]|uniref:hypothetical protein n=1 Tax=Mycolicibacterium peregrinum TaxID=43304 RepID=UPI003AAD6ECA